jgi:hypothetical protein
MVIHHIDTAVTLRAVVNALNFLTTTFEALDRIKVDVLCILLFLLHIIWITPFLAISLVLQLLRSAEILPF